MPWALFDITVALPAYALVLFRLSGLVMVAPVYSSRMIPVRIRVALTFVVAAMMFPLVRGGIPADVTLMQALVGGVGELIVGVTIGLSLSILMMSGQVAGLIVGRQASIGLANVFDPTRNEQTSIVGQIYTITLTLVFLLAGGHRAAMAAVLDTYEMIPPLSFSVNESVLVLLAEMMASAFVLGIRLSAPVLIALFLMGTALGFLSRTMPQMNILSVGFTLRVMVGLGVAAVALQAGEQLMLDAVWDGLGMIREGMGLDPSRLHLVG